MNAGLSKTMSPTKDKAIQLPNSREVRGAGIRGVGQRRQGEPIPQSGGTVRSPSSNSTGAQNSACSSRLLGPCHRLCRRLPGDALDQDVARQRNYCDEKRQFAPPNGHPFYRIRFSKQIGLHTSKENSRVLDKRRCTLIEGRA